MITIISPAKSMDFDSPINEAVSSTTSFQEQQTKLLQYLQQLSASNIQNIMKISNKLAKLNYHRFQNHHNLPERQSLFAYNGDVYNNIDTDTLNTDNLKFAQQHLRIISGFYGLLKPLDKIKPYRLEMVTRLPDIAPKGLNHYWQNLITQNINKQLSAHTNQIIVNLASNEYLAAINTKILNFPLINISFREIRNGLIKNIALNSKKARGMMADFIIREKIDKLELLKNFNKSGYIYSKDNSSNSNFMFIKE